MANIGEQLLTPESGWKRVDDHKLTYTSDCTFYPSTSLVEGGHTSIPKTGSARFNFVGDKIRIIAYTTPDQSDNVSIEIDGIVEYYSSVGNAQVVKVLVYEKVGLSNNEHIIKLTSPSNFCLDAIDINSDGEIKPYNPWVNKTKSSISQMQIGDRISFEYTATSNTFGTFANLGKAAKLEIPVASTATPDGTAYFIHTGYDLRGRMKLVADRNIQHSISWDTLNSAGVASGSGLPTKIDGNDCIVRLMTGGVSSAHKDNEWDKIIVEGTLNGTITAGDDNVWNWSGNATWSSTTIAANAVYRSYPAINTHVPIATNGIYGTIGFRPILLVEPQNSFYLILKNNSAYSCSNNQLVEVAKDWSGLSNAQKQGLFTSREFPTVSVLSGLGQFSVLTFSESNTAAKVVVSAVPFKTALPTGYTPRITGSAKPQFVYASEDVDLSGSEHIDWIHMNHEVTNSVTGNSKLKYVFSIDKGLTWKTYKGGNFVDILHTEKAEDGAMVGERFVPSTAAMERLLTDGLDKAAFDAAPWHDITIGVNNKLIRFASVFDLDKATDQCFNDNLAYQYDSLNVWKQAVHGLDYEVRYNSPSKLEVKFLTGGYKAKINY